MIIQSFVKKPDFFYKIIEKIVVQITEVTDCMGARQSIGLK